MFQKFREFVYFYMQVPFIFLNKKCQIDINFMSIRCLLFCFVLFGLVLNYIYYLSKKNFKTGLNIELASLNKAKKAYETLYKKRR